MLWTLSACPDLAVASPHRGEYPQAREDIRAKSEEVPQLEAGGRHLRGPWRPG